MTDRKNQLTPSLAAIMAVTLLVSLNISGTTAEARSHKVQAEDSQPDSSESGQRRMLMPENAEIKGFHPIKKAMQPIQNLEGLAIKLQAQIINLETPLGYLQPAMSKLRNQVTTMNTGLDTLQGQLDHMATTVKGVRSDVNDLEKEIRDLNGPISNLIKPITNVSKPMMAVNDKLTLVLIFVILAALAIAFGTPLFGILLYMKRYTLFPALFRHQPSVTNIKTPVEH